MKFFPRETLVSALLFRGISAGSCATQSGVDITVYGSASTPGKQVYPYFLCNGQNLVPGSMGQNQNTVLSAGKCCWTGYLKHYKSIVILTISHRRRELQQSCGVGFVS